MDFIDYNPSSYEKHWTDNIANFVHKQEFKKDIICEETRKQSAEADKWIQHTSSPHGTADSSIFSYFRFRNNCTGEIIVDYIEPLVGLTRSPYLCIHGDSHVVEKNYLLVSENISKHVSGHKAYLFDLGASLYNSGAGGASQQWFVETYEAKGIKWDGIFAWEAQSYSPADMWALIPGRLKPVYHLYNIPVNTEPEHADNALNYILSIARPEDYVLLKIDIDNTPVEEALVEQILSSKDLMSRIDEFYFEHHVNAVPMNNYWGTSTSPRTLIDTYRIFTTMRKAGILAHGWV
jgi:hypothetical protein